MTRRPLISLLPDGGRLHLQLRQRSETLAVGPDYAHLFKQW